MLRKKLRVVSPRLVDCLSAVSLFTMLGCGTAPMNSPSPTLPSPTTTAGSNVATGAILGYVWDQTATGLRPIFGVPGAAQFGSPIYGGAAYNNAVACADKKFALLTNSGGQAAVAPLPSGMPVQVADHLSAKEQIAISPTCSAALLYAPGSSNATLVLGLPAIPKAQSLDLSQAGAITSAVVSDTGLVLAASGQTAGATSVTAISTDGSATQITTVASFGGMSFLPSTQNALIADGGRSTIWMASNLPANSLNRVASTADGVTQPVAVASSSDGRWIVVANQSGTILRLDLTRQSAPAQAVCKSCTAPKLIPLGGNSTFLLSDLTSGPIWTFDGDSPSPRIVFIPAIKASTTAGVAR
ncbi:hypothetical protein H7849_02285 [Alloacidobacterium dinghuense]|uniref:Uncharacterized protein n=1 Tax=Alloacidobacterium dinghuense TaxID=2763107 RepID=A0A7G8BJY0_9BACT|nr:hypothetical protein [Alloacidobacterium dinghuense]QNI32850.1 hypothetical protein H7849_02285 [Alloacidobacterium dinghuense]